jgi:hypothetical protein
LQENLNNLDPLQDLLKENNKIVPIMDYVFEIPFINFLWEKQVARIKINQ